MRTCFIIMGNVYVLVLVYICKTKETSLPMSKIFTKGQIAIIMFSIRKILMEKIGLFALED